MPIYNEGARICHNLTETCRTLAQAGWNFEIIAINDGSKDNSLEEARKSAKEYPQIKVVENLDHQGKGFALKTGFSYATGELIIFLDSDLDIPPSQIEALYEVMLRQKCDVVVGSKFHPQSRLNYPTSRKIVSHIYMFIIWSLFNLPIRDTQTGIKIFKAAVLKKVFPRIMCKKFAFDVEILAVARKFGFKIAESPVVINYRRKVVWGRMGANSLFVTGMDTLAVFYRLYILKYYDRPIPQISRYPMVSIIITAGKSSAYLEESIQQCLRLNYPSFEIIALPDESPSPCPLPQGRGESDLSACPQAESLKGNNALNSFGLGTDRNIEGDIVKIIPTGKINPAAKRDIGAEAARGEILAFLDDDAYPSNNWLLNAVRNFADPEVAAVGGPAITPESDGLLQQAGGIVYISWLVSGPYVYRYMPKSFRYVEDYPTCNFLVRRQDFQQAGGFDTKFWPGEDTFFCLKLVKQLERKIVYDPDVEVYHHRRALFEGHLRQIRNYARHRGYFAKRFPETSCKPAYFVPSLFVLTLATGWLTLGMPLLVACVQSLLQKTEQRPDTRCGCSDMARRPTSSRVRFIRPICWRKNSPVPDAHLFPVWIP